MYNELINIINKWGIDIRTISIKHYEKNIEILINEHYIYTINKA